LPSLSARFLFSRDEGAVKNEDMVGALGGRAIFLWGYRAEFSTASMWWCARSCNCNWQAKKEQADDSQLAPIKPALLILQNCVQPQLSFLDRTTCSSQVQVPADSAQDHGNVGECLPGDMLHCNQIGR
jgi:hypothetical protein